MAVEFVQEVEVEEEFFHTFLAIAEVVFYCIAPQPGIESDGEPECLFDVSEVAFQGLSGYFLVASNIHAIVHLVEQFLL